MKEELPIAYVVIKHHRGLQSNWIVRYCPFCQGEHEHGAGRPGIDDPNENLGSRLSHCYVCKRQEYRLIRLDTDDDKKSARRRRTNNG